MKFIFAGILATCLTVGSANAGNEIHYLTQPLITTVVDESGGSEPVACEKPQGVIKRVILKQPVRNAVRKVISFRPVRFLFGEERAIRPLQRLMNRVKNIC
tara:strand:- start:59 stop:361 length:303 start_codon:yes stop_codon:yes gene_type:complete